MIVGAGCKVIAIGFASGPGSTWITGGNRVPSVDDGAPVWITICWANRGSSVMRMTPKTRARAAEGESALVVADRRAGPGGQSVPWDARGSRAGRISRRQSRWLAGWD